MHPIPFIILFSSCVSSLVLQPLITPAPQIDERAVAQSICGYYSLNDGLTDTLSCDFGTPCLVATNLSPAVMYCSGDVSGPITSVYPWGGWPDQGCGYGTGCCPVLTPSVGRYVFNGGSTVVLGCDSTRFAYSAFVSAPLTPSAVSAATIPTSTTALTTTNPNAGLASPTTPNTGLDSTATPTAPLPSQTSTSSSGISSKTAIIVIVVGAVVALTSGLVFLWFLYSAWKLHHKAKYPQPQSPFQHSNPSLNSMGAVKNKKRLSKWSKIITIISPIFAIIGLVVSIYFGLKQK